MLPKYFTRVVCGAGVAVAAAAGPARADLVATFQSVSPSAATNLNLSGPNIAPMSFTNEPTGGMNFTVAGGSDAAKFGAGVGSGIQSFCSDLHQYVSYGGTYTYQVQTDLSKLPELQGPNQGLKAAMLQQLWGDHYADTTTSTGAAAFQLAVWEILYDPVGGFDVGGGNFIASGNADATAQANTWLGGLTGDTSSFVKNYAGYSLVGITSDSNQDQITLMHKPVPAPPAVLLGLIGATALFTRRRPVTAA